jgi:hypothetical protein
MVSAVPLLRVTVTPRPPTLLHRKSRMVVVLVLPVIWSMLT